MKNLDLDERYVEVCSPQRGLVRVIALSGRGVGLLLLLLLLVGLVLLLILAC